MPSGYVERVWKGKFCGTKEIADFANVSKAQIAHWLKTDWFPQPVDEPAMGRVWDYKEVVSALAARGYPRVGEKMTYPKRLAAMLPPVDEGEAP
jgi:hypothetical protein